MQLPYEYRCAHCHHTDEVLIDVPSDSAEGPSWQLQFAANAALAIRRCPKCSRRDWSSVVLRLGGMLLMLHLGFGAVLFVLGVAGRTLRGLPDIVNSGPLVIALAWLAIVFLTIVFTLSEWSEAARSLRVRSQ